jgi:disulfide bond formation protein DsbB
VALLFLVSAGLGLMHAGVEQKWWHIDTTCTDVGGVNLQDVFAKPVVRCDEIPWSLFGLSMAGYNALLSFAAAATLFFLLRRR